MSLYNLTPFYNASNPLMMIQAINTTTDMVFGSTMYVVIGLGIMIAIFYSTNDVNKSLGIGGFLASAIGIPMAILELIPIYFPFVFFTLALVGVILRISGGRAE